MSVGVAHDAYAARTSLTRSDQDEALAELHARRARSRRGGITAEGPGVRARGRAVRDEGHLWAQGHVRGRSAVSRQRSREEGEPFYTRTSWQPGSRSPACAVGRRHLPRDARECVRGRLPDDNLLRPVAARDALVLARAGRAAHRDLPRLQEQLRGVLLPLYLLARPVPVPRRHGHADDHLGWRDEGGRQDRRGRRRARLRRRLLRVVP